MGWKRQSQPKSTIPCACRGALPATAAQQRVSSAGPQTAAAVRPSSRSGSTDVCHCVERCGSRPSGRGPLQQVVLPRSHADIIIRRIDLMYM